MNTDIYEGVSNNSKQFSAAEEESQRQEQAAADAAAAAAAAPTETAAAAAAAAAATAAAAAAAAAAASTGTASGTTTTCPTTFDCSNHINNLDESPSSITCATSTCTQQECCTSAPAPSNTPFVSAEYVKLREKARQKDGPIVTKDKDTPTGTGATEPTPSSDEKDFVEKKEVKLTPVQKKFRIGPYDGLCVSSDKLTEEDLVPNKDLLTYFGVHGPTQIRSSQDVLTGPTIDGEKDSPQKLTMFANNKTKFNCCGESPYTTSTGCLCLTEKQRNYIRSRGFNKTSPDI